MSDALDPTVLDEAYDRLAATDFELPNGFVNHGPMACEALDALGRTDMVDRWARGTVDRVPGPAPAAVAVTEERFGWEEALGDYHRLPEWLGFYAATVEEEGWAATVALWVPRLVPALSTALFHGAIRTAHAVRAVRTVDTPSRPAELARSLAYWSARFRPGEVAGRPGAGTALGDARDEVLLEAADGAAHFLTRPDIFNLHGVTGTMAVELLIDHLAPADAERAVRQARAELDAMHGGRTAAVADTELPWDDRWVEVAAHSGDPHQVKLVEACHRGHLASGDPDFALSAQVVTAPG